MKRYRPDTTLTGEEAITEDNFGEYVKYSEVAIKIGESITSVEQANQAVLAASDTIQKLVAENAALKKSRQHLGEFIIEEIKADYPLNMKLETPATDAAIAEVKAHDINLLIDKLSGLPFTIGVSCGYVKEFAANLRAGRKG